MGNKRGGARRLSLAATLLALFSTAANGQDVVALWQVEQSDLTESSGLVLSERNPTAVWTHNDSGNSASLFLLSLETRKVSRWAVDYAAPVDWEDICLVRCGQQSYLAIADTGNNSRERERFQILFIQEPDNSLQEDLTQQKAWPVTAIAEGAYPDGRFDCEAIAFDPLDERLLLFTKGLFSTRVYALDLPIAELSCQANAANLQARRPLRVTAQLVFLGELPVSLVTGADMSRDGCRLALCTYGPVYLVNVPMPSASPEQSIRKDNASDESESKRVRSNSQAEQGIGQELGNHWRFFDSEIVPLAVPPRKQGESVCFNRRGDRIFLSSEFSPMPLFEVAIQPMEQSN